MTKLCKSSWLCILRPLKTFLFIIHSFLFWSTKKTWEWKNVSEFFSWFYAFKSFSFVLIHGIFLNKIAESFEQIHWRWIKAICGNFHKMFKAKNMFNSFFVVSIFIWFYIEFVILFVHYSYLYYLIKRVLMNLVLAWSRKNEIFEDTFVNLWQYMNTK